MRLTVPEENYDSRSLLVDLPHQAYLLGLLNRVILVDADRIYPNMHSSRIEASIVQRIIRVLCNLEPEPVN